MRRFLLLGVCVAISTGAAAQAETIRAHVSGMHCVGCAQAITAVLNEEPAVASVDVNVKCGKLTIVEKPAQHISDARISAAVREAGYSVTSIRRSPL